MLHQEQMKSALDRISGRSYPSYRQIKGSWDFGSFTLFVDHVQGDPFAAPSRIRVRTAVELPASVTECSDAVLAAEDWLLRQFASALPNTRRGSGKSGQLSCLKPGPEIEERTAVRIQEGGHVEFRFRAGLPAQGRRVLGREAWEMFNQDVRSAVSTVQNAVGIDRHIASVQRQRHLRRLLGEAGLVAFVEDGSILPRVSGVDFRPLADAVPFHSPESLRVRLEHRGESVTGMGIPSGVSVIVGGGFHGKSTLLNAIQRGHLDHVPGDGREGVVSVYDVVKVRAEDGRSVSSVDISPFLGALPGGRKTKPFSTRDASGSTSQAAAIVEALESGAKLLLLDEDTSATNLMVRDERMRELIGSEHEPITPFVERVRQIYDRMGISTILVIGGVVDYIGVADSVVGMVDFCAIDLSDKARAMGIQRARPPGPLSLSVERVPVRGTFSAQKISARDNRAIRFDRSEIDLVGVEQILSADHAWSVGQAVRRLHDLAADGETVVDLLDKLDREIDTNGLEALSPRREPSGEIIRPRRHEVAAALNRLRALTVQHPDKS